MSAEQKTPGSSPGASAEDRERLPRLLGVWSAGAILVGSTIGSGIFRVPSIAAEAGSIGAVAMLWLLGAFIALCGVLTIAELATMFPRPGGIYVFLRETYGPVPAFLFGWTRLLVIQPAALGAIAMIFASYAKAFVPLSDAGVRIIAATLIVTLAAANYRSLRWGASVQNVSTVAKVVALVGLAILLFALGDAASGALRSAPALSSVAWGGFGLALIAIMWTYDGWGDVTYIAGEVRDPGRTLPRALIGGLLVVVAVYLTINAAFLFVLSLDEMAASPLVAADAATRVFGAAGAAAAAALVMLSTFGALNGCIMTGPRTFFAMADDGLFFRRIAAVHHRFRTPHAAITLAALLGIAYVSLRTFEQLTEAFILGIWPFYMLTVTAVLILRRKRPDQPRPYRALGYPVLPLLFLLASGALIGNALIRQPLSTLFGFGIILSGLPVFYLWRGLRRDAGPSEPVSG